MSLKKIIEQANKDHLERALLTQIRMYGLPEGQAQFRAVPGRKWAWDRAWPELRLLVEVQGGIMSSKVKGADGLVRVMGHNSISGILRDHEKHNAATLEGWYVLYANTKTINDASFVQTLARYITKRQV